MDTTVTVAGAFKVCGSCGRLWDTWDAFVTDPEVRLLGLQSIAAVPEATLLVFEHFCGSSVSVLTRRLHHLVPDHPAAQWPSLRGTEECPGLCLSLAERDPCDRHCRHARNREILALASVLQAGRKARRPPPLDVPPPAL